jgi:hypothetical protein
MAYFMTDVAKGSDAINTLIRNANADPAAEGQAEAATAKLQKLAAETSLSDLAAKPQIEQKAAQTLQSIYANPANSQMTDSQKTQMAQAKFLASGNPRLVEYGNKLGAQSTKQQTNEINDFEIKSKQAEIAIDDAKQRFSGISDPSQIEGFIATLKDPAAQQQFGQLINMRNQGATMPQLQEKAASLFSNTKNRLDYMKEQNAAKKADLDRLKAIESASRWQSQEARWRSGEDRRDAASGLAWLNTAEKLGIPVTEDDLVERGRFSKEQARAAIRSYKEQGASGDSGDAAKPETPTDSSAKGATQTVSNDITDKVLDGLKRTESSGNNFAVNKDTKALGPYQFLPETAADMNKRGIKFNPFDEKESREAAKKYLTQLKDESGGDLRKALGKYGGFVTKDPTAYVNSVLGEKAPQAATTDAKPSTAFEGAVIPKRAAQAAAGREARYADVVAISGNEAIGSINNIVTLPFSASSGVLGSAKPSTNIFTAPLDALANTATEDETQRYNSELGNIGKFYARLISGGLQISKADADSFIDQYRIKVGDKELAKLTKLAQMRQTFERAAEVKLKSKATPKEQIDLWKNGIEEIRAAIPITVKEVNAIGNQRSPSKTISDAIKDAKREAAGSTPSQGWGKAEKVQ